jgi:hypothetical protein
MRKKKNKIVKEVPIISSSNHSKVYKAVNLVSIFPFLKTEFKTLNESDLSNPEILQELFPGESETNTYKLRAIYEYQQAIKNINVQSPEIVSESKTQDNGEV